MEKSTYLGIGLALIGILVGMVLKGANIGVLANPAAFLIIIVGTVGAVLNAFPMHEIGAFVKFSKYIFKDVHSINKIELIQQFNNWAQIARKEGLLALERSTAQISDHFLKTGLEMVIDGGDPAFVKDILEEEINAMRERHKIGAMVYTQAGTYAPTLGVLGAVVGLIAALGNLKDVDNLGHAIAGAFVATMFGIFFGYVIAHPFSNKLKRKSVHEIELREMMVVGILALQSGTSPTAIVTKLTVFIPPKDRQQLEKKRG